jgi:glucokinase
MKKQKDTILALDAGGTNLVFNAVRNSAVLGEVYSLPAKSANLEELLTKIKRGFLEIDKVTGNRAAAISFCFPGPADYENGIIGDLENLPLFRGGVALKKFLENEFKIPVFINNDGDLFTLGEAIEGLLPEMNALLKNNGIGKQYKNMLGVTLGTGFGGGIVSNGALLLGDNSSGAEINRMSNPLDRNSSVEEVLSIRGIKRLFSIEAEISLDLCPEPADIYKIGTGMVAGNKNAAIKAWNTFGSVLADAIANAVTLVDGLVVIGGGLAGAHHLFLPITAEELNRKFQKISGGTVPRLETAAYNFENQDSLAQFLRNDGITISVPFSGESLTYYPEKKIGVGISRLGTSHAVAIGAYAFAASKLGW